MADDALVLLSYLAREHPKGQSLSILSEATGIPEGTLYQLLDDSLNKQARRGNTPILDGVARQHGFKFKIMPGWKDQNRYKTKMIIDAIATGYFYPLPARAVKGVLKKEPGIIYCPWCYSPQPERPEVTAKWLHIRCRSCNADIKEEYAKEGKI